LRIYAKRPRGSDIFFDSNKALLGFETNGLFDLGENIGQSAREFRATFPAATLYCLEPVDDSFEKLAAAFRHDPKTIAVFGWSEPVDFLQV